VEPEIRTRLVQITVAVITLVGLTLLAIDAAGRPTFTSSWRSPAASGVTFAGKKVAALVISGDEHLRVSVEEQLARELGTRRIEGVPTYRIAPREELSTADRARPWFERNGIEGVVALRPVSLDVQRTYAPAVWTSTSYSTLWGYYGYGWTTVYTPGVSRADTTLVVETLVYSVPLDALLWGGVSTTTNPKDAPVFIQELVNAAVKEMQRRGLIK
jgi:hypothetical protein